MIEYGSLLKQNLFSAKNKKAATFRSPFLSQIRRIFLIWSPPIFMQKSPNPPPTASYENYKSPGH